MIFPDQTIEHFRPPSADFVYTEMDKLQLRTQIDISQPAWTGNITLIIFNYVLYNLNYMLNFIII